MMKDDVLDIYVAIISSRSSAAHRDALFHLTRINSMSVIEIESYNANGSARMWIAAWLVAAVVASLKYEIF